MASEHSMRAFRDELMDIAAASSIERLKRRGWPRERAFEHSEEISRGILLAAGQMMDDVHDMVAASYAMHRSSNTEPNFDCLVSAARGIAAVRGVEVADRAYDEFLGIQHEPL